MAINILHIVKSKVLRKWKGLDDRITDGANEAKDNIKVHAAPCCPTHLLIKINHALFLLFFCFCIMDIVNILLSL